MPLGIFIDAGHGLSASGAEDNGASVPTTNERKEVIEVAQELTDRLHLDQDIELEVFPIGVAQRLSLVQKIKNINDIIKEKGWKREDALLVSIHMNFAADAGVRGVEGWYGKGKTPDFADVCIDEVSKATGIPKRKTNSSDKNRLGRLGILDDINATSVLVECGFLTNSLDDAIIENATLDDAYAIGLHRAIRIFLGLPAEHIASDGFLDVPNGSWFAEPVMRMLDAGVLKMPDDRLFHPERPVTRAEMVTMLSRFSDFLEQ